jgi:multidrug efflux pump subunit AcrB
MFVLVMAMGVSSYLIMPREQDPSINFNWIDVTTVYPGASTGDVEKQVTNVLEDAIRKVSDIKFVSSNSREGISSILIRFDEIPVRVFEKRLADLRREIEGVEDELPRAVLDPFIFEITTDNAFPTATVVVSSVSDDENLRRQATLIKQDIEQLKGVGRILENGLSDPEIHIIFDPQRLEQYGVNPIDLGDTIRLYYQNVSAGKIDVARSNWAVKITGSRYDLEYLGNLPILTTQGEIPLKDVADIIQAKEPARELVRYNQRPAVLLAITKQEKQNILQLVERISGFLEQKKPAYESLGVTATVVDDQTQITRDALKIMQTNAMIGLLMVFVVTWTFLGTRIAFLTGIAIPFILSGTFWFLSSVDQTLNVTVLLGVVISLGMLVDDAVVVVEAIYYRLQRGGCRGA